MGSDIKTKRDTIERALIHHGIQYSPPEPGRSQFCIHTSVGYVRMTVNEASAFCIGLATKAEQRGA